MDIIMVVLQHKTYITWIMTFSDCVISAFVCGKVGAKLLHGCIAIFDSNYFFFSEDDCFVPLHIFPDWYLSFFLQLLIKFGRIKASLLHNWLIGYLKNYKKINKLIIFIISNQNIIHFYHLSGHFCKGSLFGNRIMKICRIFIILIILRSFCLYYNTSNYEFKLYCVI